MLMEINTTDIVSIFYKVAYVFLVSNWHVHRKLSPESEASSEVANLTWRKNPHAPAYGLNKQGLFSLSVIFPMNYINKDSKFI